MQPISNAQLKKIHVLLRQFGVMEDKKELVLQFTNGREESSRKLTMEEAKNLLSHLSQYDPLDRMRRKVFALAYSADIIWGDSKENRQINIAKLNMFLREKGTVKKDLNKMNKVELIKVIGQFEQIKKHKQESKASKETKNMLGELGILTSNKRAKNPL